MDKSLWLQNYTWLDQMEILMESQSQKGFPIIPLLCIIRLCIILFKSLCLYMLQQC